MLNPTKGRVTITGNTNQLRITIPSKKHWFIAVFFGFWLIVWAFGWVMAVGTLFSGTAGAASIFLIGWLGVWTAGGVVAFSVVLWIVAGREVVEMTADKVTVRREIPIWSRKTECDAAIIRKLRANTQPAPMPFLRHNTPGLWSGRAQGEVQFTYGVHTIGFGLEIDAAEAAKTVEIITEHFPQFAAA